MESLKNLIENSDFIVLIFGLFINLFVSINTSENSKKGVNNFIVGYYVILIIYNLFALEPINLVNNSFFPFVLLLGLHFSKALIISISNEDALIQCLAPLQIIAYFFLEIFFVSKLYLTYLYSILILIFPSYFLNVIFSIAFLFFQLVNQINNNFEVRKFNDLYNKSFKFSVKEQDKLEYTEVMLDLLTFLLYMEDRDFMNRNGYTLNVFNIFVRKYLISTNRDPSVIDFEITKKEYFSENFRKGLTKKDAIQVGKFAITNLKNVFKLFQKDSYRGYGVMPQQIVRINTLINFGTYDRFYVRRKLFIEFVYVSFFFKALYKMYLQDPTFNYFCNVNNLKNDERQIVSKMLVKRSILFSYYGKLLKFPRNKEELFQAMKEKAKTSKSIGTLEKKWMLMETEYIAAEIKQTLYWDFFNYNTDIEVKFPKTLGM